MLKGLLDWYSQTIYLIPIKLIIARNEELSHYIHVWAQSILPHTHTHSSAFIFDCKFLIAILSLPPFFSFFFLLQEMIAWLERWRYQGTIVFISTQKTLAYSLNLVLSKHLYLIQMKLLSYTDLGCWARKLRSEHSDPVQLILLILSCLT